MTKPKRTRKRAEPTANVEPASVNLPALVSNSLARVEESRRDIDADTLREMDSHQIIDAVAAEVFEATPFVRRVAATEADEDSSARARSRRQRAQKDVVAEAPAVAPTSSAPPRWRPNALTATLGIAGACGALAGSLATLGLLWLFPPRSTTTVAPTDLAQKFARIDAEFGALKANLLASGTASTAASVTASSIEGGDHQESAEAPPDAAGDDTTGSIGQGPAAASPPAVDGWILRNVYGGAAVVEGPPGLIQIMPGDSLPGVGRIEAIRRQDGRWVVVTSRGFIVTR